MINLYHIDCMELMASKPDNFYDLAIVDPPYFSGPEKRRYYGKSVSSHGVKRINHEPIKESWTIPDIEYYKELLRVSKHQIIWGINYFEFVNVVGPGRIIWDKVNEGSTFSNCEIASCSLQQVKVSIFRFMWRGMMQGSPENGSKMNGDKSKNEKKIHPTQKPVHLYKWILKNYGNKGDKILDTHLGSGSIAIACHDYGFDLDASELNKHYYNLAENRLNNHQAQMSMFAS